MSGFVEVGVRPVLPVKGVSFILGNDLAGGKVVPSIEVIDTLSIEHSSDELSQKYPNAFTACVITRAQSKKDEVSLSDSFLCVDQDAEEGPENKSHVSDQVSEVVVSDPLTLTVNS